MKMDIMEIVKRRIEEFNTLGNVGFTVFDFSPFLKLKIKATLWSELAFCISTANSSAISGLYFQKRLENFELQDANIMRVERLLKAAGVRFYSRKAKYVVDALLNFDNVYRILRLRDKKARELLVKTVKGLGYKEASHFLRNVGRKDVAIIDRHILRWLYEKDYIDKVPSNVGKRTYLELETILKDLSYDRGISLAELDLILWYEKTKKILK